MAMVHENVNENANDEEAEEGEILSANETLESTLLFSI